MTARRLGELIFCFVDFPDDSEPLTVSLRAPNGDCQEGEAWRARWPAYRVDHDAVVWAWSTNFSLDMPLGRYLLDVRQAPAGSSPAPHLTGAVVVTRAASPTFEIRDVEVDVAIDFAGYPSGSNIEAFLYGPQDSGKYPFNRKLPAGSVGRYGEGSYRERLPAGLAPGYYAVWFSPPGCGLRPCLTVSVP